MRLVGSRCSASVSDGAQAHRYTFHSVNWNHSMEGRNQAALAADFRPVQLDSSSRGCFVSEAKGAL